MAKHRMKVQTSSRQGGRGRKRKCEDSGDSANEDSSRMKLKIRIGGQKFKNKRSEAPESKGNISDDVYYGGIDCSIEEEVVNEEVIVYQTEGEHFEPDASYFEEVINNNDEDDDNDDEGGFDGNNASERESLRDNNESLSRMLSRKWGEEDEEEDDDDRNGEEASDDEKKWLDALESGQLNENGEVKSSNRPNAALTARQRALLFGEKAEELLELSSIQPIEMTEEQLLKRKRKALRRKQLEVEKTERDKKETLDRLLKKQDSKLKSCKNLPSKEHMNDLPHYRYTNNSTTIQIAIPPGFEFPMERQTVHEPKPLVTCGVEGCSEPKRYNCSKTSIPLCSLECYKKNLMAHSLSSSSSSLPPSPSALRRPLLHQATVS